MSGPTQTLPDLEPGVVELAEAAAERGAQPSQGDAAQDWLCVWCHQRVASERDPFHFSGQREFVFRNPEGYRFAILLFARTYGCRDVGAPTLEHTWFAGYAWSFCVCGQCGAHLGWYYSGASKFAGLIRNRIVRAVAVWN